MYFSVDNDSVVFATHIITVDGQIDEEIQLKLSSQIEINKIIIYTEEELSHVINILNNLKIPFTTEQQIIPQELLDKLNNIKFNSRSEAIRYIDNNKIPESEIIPTLAKKLIDTELENFELKQDNNILGNIIVDLELRLLQLEANN